MTYIVYQAYKTYHVDMKTLAPERYFSFSYIEETFLYIEEKALMQRLLYITIYRKKRYTTVYTATL